MIRFPASAALVAAACLVSSCGMQPQQSTAYNMPAICVGKEACDIMWGQALKFVQENCAYRIQSMTELLIQTYKSGDNADTGMGCEVSRYPMGAGRYQISPRFWINNMFMGSQARAAESRFNGIMLELAGRLNPDSAKELNPPSVN